jgi:hypothetical protein
MLKKFVNLQLKFRKNKNYHEKRTAHWYIGTSVLLKPLPQHLIDVTSFRHLKSLCSRYVPFKCTNNFGSVFTNRLDHRLYETKFPTHISFLSFHFLCLISL